MLQLEKVNILVFLFYLTAVNCLPVDTYFGIDVNKTNFYPYLSKLNLRCREGEEFSDESTDIEVVCELKGTWIPLPLTCTGI